MSRSTVAVPCGEPPRRQRSRAHIDRERRWRGRPDSGRGTATRKRAVRPRRDVVRHKTPRAPQQPPTGRIPCPEAPAPMPDSMPHACAPPTPKPAPALLGRAGSHAGGRPARAATLFRVLRPMRCAREQREKLTSGDLYNHARLRFLPCRRARAACDSRDARHATGAGLKSLRSKT